MNELLTAIEAAQQAAVNAQTQGSGEDFAAYIASVISDLDALHTSVADWIRDH